MTDRQAQRPIDLIRCSIERLTATMLVVDYTANEKNYLVVIPVESMEGFRGPARTGWLAFIPDGPSEISEANLSAGGLINSETWIPDKPKEGEGFATREETQ